ncbi:MAG: glycosyltransferase family 4 protein [Ktedonobacteraceae bacterium]
MMMRVAIITENFLPKRDGVTHTLVQLLEHLRAQGHSALLLGPDSGMTEYAGAEIVGTAGLPLPFYPELKFNFFRPLFVRRLNEFDPDIVHLVDPVILGATGLAMAHLLNKPLVSSYHTNLAAYCDHFGFSLLSKPMWLYNRLMHSACGMTFCPSLSTAAMLRLQGFANLRLWPRGVDTALFRSERRSQELRRSWFKESGDIGGIRDSGLLENKTILLYVGRVSWEKNLRLLVQTYRGMDHRHCHLVIVGDGPAYAEMQQELAGLPVTFTGYLSGEALATAYASADIFAFPSRTETFGQVVLEAMASGLPVVGLLAEGVCDLVEHNRTGLLLNTHSLDEEEQVIAYRQLLTQLIEEPHTRYLMGQAALTEAQKFSWYEAMECLMRGYQEVIEHAQIMVAA